jgi:outer membrane receptor protein involved in Fe transport
MLISWGKALKSPGAIRAIFFYTRRLSRCWDRNRWIFLSGKAQTAAIPRYREDLQRGQAKKDTVYTQHLERRRVYIKNPKKIIIAALCVLLITPTFAQQLVPAIADVTPALKKGESARAPDQQSPSSGVTTVIVTAQKRKEDLHKIAMSLSALPGANLQEQHITDFADLTRAIPNISFSGNNGIGPGLDNIEIRGISSSAGSATVGVYMDDTPITIPNVYSMGNVEPKFFDLDRVEILRGPQGTLYGASSMGGTIKFVANQPDLKHKETTTFAQLSSTRGGGVNNSAYVIGNIPLLTNELALRIGVQINKMAGFIDQVDNGNVIASGVNSATDQEARLAMKWKPTKNLTILPTIYYQTINLNGGSSFDVNTLPAYDTNIIVREPSSDSLLIPALTLSYDMENGHNLTSISSFFQRNFDRQMDGKNYVTGPLIDSCSLLTAACVDSSPSGIANAPDGLADTILGLPAPTSLVSKVQQFSQELRLTSKAYDQTVSPWTWVSGLYFSNQRTSIIENDPVTGVNAAFTQYGVAVTDPTVLYFPGNPSLGIPEGTPYDNPFPNDNLYYGNEYLREQQTAIFGSADYYFSPNLHATVGMRYLVANNSMTQINGLYTAGLGSNDYETITHATHSRAATPRFALTWETSPTNTLYTSAAKGFRLGGGNEYVPPIICQTDLTHLGLTEAPATYDQDSLWSYEMGHKSRFLDNRLSISTSLFYVNWQNLQQFVLLPSCQYEYNTNVGNATSTGVELEVRFKPTARLLLGMAAGYTKAELSDNDGLVKDGIPGAVSGAAIEGVPKYNAHISAKYNFLVSDDTPGFVMGALHWVGSSHGSLDPSDPDYLRPQYHTLDLSTGLALEAFDMSIFIKNALDNDTVIQHVNVNGAEAGYRVNPREIGINISAKF